MRDSLDLMRRSACRRAVWTCRVRGGQAAKKAAALGVERGCGLIESGCWSMRRRLSRFVEAFSRGVGHKTFAATLQLKTLRFRSVATSSSPGAGSPVVRALLATVAALAIAFATAFWVRRYVLEVRARPGRHSPFA